MTEPHAAYAEIRADYDRLIARRDELILAGVDPAELLIPTRPLPPPGPRSWSLPPEPPEDVRKVRDELGVVFIRGEVEARISHLWKQSDNGLVRPFAELLLARGPLTEVVDSDG